MEGVEFALWMNRREVDALKAALRERGQDDLEAAMRDMFRAFYEESVPETVRESIAREIHAEELVHEREAEANRRRSGIIFRESGATTFYESNTAFDELSMAGLIRRYVRNELDGYLDDHFNVRGGGPILRDEMRRLIEMREQNSSVVTGIFLVDLDMGVYGTLQVTEGWRFYPLRTVSTACYHTLHSSRRSYFRRLDIYWAYLDGKALSRDQYHIDI